MRAHEQGHLRAQGAARRCSRASTSSEPSVHVLRGAEVRVDADRPVHGLRRRRPGRRAADDLPRPARAPCRCCSRHDRSSTSRSRPRAPPARCRGAPGAAAPRCPARSSCAWSPTPSARLAARLERGSAVISATNGKTTTAAMVAGILERTGAHLVHNRAGANMAGGVAAALMSGPRDGDTGLFEVDEFWLGQVVERAAPARAAAGQPLPRPARPLRRARLDRRPLGGGGGAARRPRSSSTPTTRRSPTSARARRPRRRGLATSRGDLLRRRGRRDGPAGDAARRRRHALPALRRALPLRRRLPRATSAATTATAAARRAPNRRSAPATSCSRASAARASRCPRRRATAPSRCRCPASTTSTTRSGRRRWRSRWARRLDHVDAGLHAVSPAFGRAETLRIAGRELSILLVKNPAGANEVLRTLALEAGEHDVFAVAQRQHRRRARRELGLGRRLRGPRPARAARDVQRHARRRDGAAAQVRRRAHRPHRRRARPRDGPRPGPARAATGGCSRCPPTRRCSRCATCSSRAAPRRGRSR